MTAEDKKTCFIAMPITTHDNEAKLYGGDGDHWVHVMETIFVPAIERAGFDPVRPQAVGSDMIHGHIVRELEKADMVLCDLSGHNPNVFFELGVRTSLDKPVTLVKDEHLGFPFDTGVLNTHPYGSSLSGWEIADEVERLCQHILASERTCAGRNPMWRHFGLTMAADKPSSENTSSTDAKLELMFESVQELRREFATMRRRDTSTDNQVAVSSGYPAFPIPDDVQSLADELEPVVGGVLRHVGLSKTPNSYGMRFGFLSEPRPIEHILDDVRAVAEVRGFALIRTAEFQGGLSLAVRRT